MCPADIEAYWTIKSEGNSLAFCIVFIRSPGPFCEGAGTAQAVTGGVSLRTYDTPSVICSAIATSLKEGGKIRPYGRTEGLAVGADAHIRPLGSPFGRSKDSKWIDTPEKYGIITKSFYYGALCGFFRYYVLPGRNVFMLKRFFTDLRKYFSFSVVSAKSQLKTEVAGSYLNWIWWILDPLCFMLIYTFIFGYVFSASEQYFPVFIFVGLSMWNFFNGTLKSSVRIVKRNKPIVSRVYFPKYILVVAQLMADAFKMMISFGIVVLMMIFFQVPISFNVLFFIPIIIILMLFTFGCSCIVMHFGVYVEDLANVINIVLRFLFYLTGIFYNIKTKIPNIGEYLNNYNPLASLITAMRDCLIYSRMPDLKFLGIWFVVSVLLTVGGVALVYKEENSYLKAV